MIDIKVFGIREELPSKEGGCGSPSGCDFSITIGEQYDSLEKFLEQKGLLSKIKLRFIDIRYIDKNEHKEIKRMLDVGFSMPYIFINEKLRFFGAVPQRPICDEINKLM